MTARAARIDRTLAALADPNRRRVIDLISSLQAFQPDAFMERQPTPITGASVLVVGEPVHRLRAEDQGRIFDPGLPGDNA